VSTKPSVPAGDLVNGVLGSPRLHLRRTDSTNERARALALAGAPHGTLVTATEQTAGRGRQGRAWLAPAGSSLLCSLVLRDAPALLSLASGVAVCDTIGEHARVKWPNDVVVGPGLAKLGGILIEGRPQEHWAVLGIGINVAVQVDRLPADVREHAASLELPASAVEPLLRDLLTALARRLAEPAQTLLDAWRARDALRGREISWGAHSPTRPSEPYARPGHGRPGPSDRAPAPVGRGRAEGIDGDGRLLVRLHDGTMVALSAGEVHLGLPRQAPHNHSGPLLG
jgi:BirA family biotin operon repressor/biotin-[acetyl-CoA-carboxylase] ligase